MIRMTSVLSISISLCALLLMTTGPTVAPVHAVAGPSLIAVDRATGGPASDGVVLQDWSPGATVVVELFNSSGVALMPPISAPVDLSGFALVPLPVALMPGQTLRASLGVVVKEITLVPLTVQADATADVVSGTGPAGASVVVRVFGGTWLAAPPVLIDSAGRYVVSIGSLAPGAASNIRYGTSFDATITDADGDGQMVEDYLASPTVSAILGNGSTVVLNGWGGFPTTMVTVQILVNPGGAVIFTASVPPDASGFVELGVPPLAVGQVVRASDGTTTKELTIASLGVQGNTATDVLSGNASPGALVTVQAHCAPATTSCAVTRLLAADGAGSFSTSLAPLVNIRGGSDLSASIADADNDRQYAKVGPAGVDTDRDGLADLVDVDPVNPSAAFSEAPTGLTLGQVLSEGGLMVSVIDAIPPDGVTTAAIGGAPGALAQVEVCVPAFVVDLTAGDRVTLTCGSLTARVFSGPVSIHVPGSPAIVTVSSGSTAKLTVLATGGVQVQNIAGTASISVTVGSVTTPVAPGSSYVVAPPLPTSADQCKDGGWKLFGVFKNQGDCVSFVATKGKNGPAH